MPRPTTRAELRREHGGFPIVDRMWFTTPEGRLIRLISWMDCEPCVFGDEPRQFTLRLRPDDPRPLGRRVFTTRDAGALRWYARHYGQYEFGQWYVSHATIRIPRYSPLTALAVVPPATLARREERVA